MDTFTEMEDSRGLTLPTLTSWSLWAVAYSQVCGVQVVGTIRGSYGRIGWVLDNGESKAKRALDLWRSGQAVVNGRDLIDAHTRLVTIIKNEN